MNEIEISEDAKLAATLAVMSAGAVDRGWKTRVQEAVPVMAALVRDDFGYWGRDAQYVLDASVFSGVYVSHEIDDRNGRVNVWLEGEKDPLRTFQVNTPPGRLMKERLDKLHAGQEIFAFKYLEPMQGRQGQRARVLVHFEVKKSRSPSDEAAGPSRASGPPPDSGPAEPPADAPSRPDSAGPGGAPSDEIQGRMDALDSKQRAKVARRCRAEGIDNFVAPAADQVFAVLDIIDQVEKGQ